MYTVDGERFESLSEREEYRTNFVRMSATSAGAVKRH